jgi:hypothetical protein
VYVRNVHKKQPTNNCDPPNSRLERQQSLITQIPPFNIFPLSLALSDVINKKSFCKSTDCETPETSSNNMHQFDVGTLVLTWIPPVLPVSHTPSADRRTEVVTSPSLDSNTVCSSWDTCVSFYFVILDSVCVSLCPVDVYILVPPHKNTQSLSPWYHGPPGRNSSFIT